MNRVIKFRAWDGRDEMFSCFGLSDVPEWVRYAVPALIQQFTGLLDKNGKEIYEGDILAVKFNHGYVERIHWKGPPDAICEVHWDYSGFHLKAKGEQDFRYSSFEDLLDEATFSGLLMMNNSHSEVIGNIYENKELIV